MQKYSIIHKKSNHILFKDNKVHFGQNDLQCKFNNILNIVVLHGALIAQLVEHEIGNLKVDSLNPGFGTVRKGHPSTQWQNGYLAYEQAWHNGR